MSNACPTILLAAALCYHYYKLNTDAIFTIVEEPYSTLRNHIVLPAKPSVIKKSKNKNKQNSFSVNMALNTNTISLHCLYKLANM